MDFLKIEKNQAKLDKLYYKLISDKVLTLLYSSLDL